MTDVTLFVIKLFLQWLSKEVSIVLKNIHLPVNVVIGRIQELVALTWYYAAKPWNEEKLYYNWHVPSFNTTKAYKHVILDVKMAMGECAHLTILGALKWAQFRNGYTPETFILGERKYQLC